MEFATSLLSSASTALAAAQKPTILSTYTPDPSVSPVQIGVWKISRAKHNSNGKQVSIWTCDKGALVSTSGLSSGASSRRDRDRDGDRLKYAIDTLKKEASSLSRLRHPCVLEMAEPPAETRSSITFATEPVLSSLQHSLDVSTRRNKSRQEEELELDEVEIQKGMSQLGKGLQFLHESAKLVHGNLTPEAVIINSKVSLTSAPLCSLHGPHLESTLRRGTGSCLDSGYRPTSSTPTVRPQSGSSLCTIRAYHARSNETMITSVRPQTIFGDSSRNLELSSPFAVLLQRPSIFSTNLRLRPRTISTLSAACSTRST